MNCSVNLPQPGQVVRVRTRTWLVENVEADPGFGSTVSLACLDDDAQGEQLAVDWGLELDRRIVSEEAWKDIGKKGFDPPREFAAFLNTLRWNCVTATDPRLFQSPFRAGIRIDPYQMVPLRKALRLPRVNLFIADDVGLGKTIEAGLIASELLLRRRVRDIVVACPPSMILQWKDELENRFGLTFEIFDRTYMEKIRRERGHTVNAWDTFPRFLISHKLLIDEIDVAPMRDWLDNLRPGSLLILDEAHHAAPSSSSKYAIDSQITKAIRNLAFRFEHRLFLSATPHNGHSNSFSSLLEILDRERFIRSVKVNEKLRDDVMIRRLKDDLRAIGVEGFPDRHVVQIDLPQALGFEHLPEETPELALAALLDRYRTIRLESMAAAPKRQKSHFELLTTQLQQRLLSSAEAFARSLRVHRATMERIWAKEAAVLPEAKVRYDQLDAVDSEDDRSTLPEEQLAELFDRETEKATLAAAADTAPTDAERRLLEEMTAIAEQARIRPDAKIQYLVKWIRENQCAGASLPGDGSPTANGPWTPRRLIIFTEWDDTKRFIEKHLTAAIAGTARWEERIEIFHGSTPFQKKEDLKRAFNTPPDEHPVRILICTDAAREGLNLQAHCYDLIHFDVPWNPARMEQRNGRIDRKLQNNTEVFCRYFFYTQRPEDKVLRVLARKTRTIKDELGSYTDVISRKLKTGIRREIAARTADELDHLTDAEADAVRDEELESARSRHADLREEIGVVDRQLNESRKAIHFDSPMLQDAISCSLKLLDVEGLTPSSNGRFTLPDLESRRGADPKWAATLDTLRPPPKSGKRDYQWRKDCPIRPVTFEAPDGIDDTVVQLHLSHRLVQRLLGRFTSQGFVYDDLSRACLATSDDSIPRVILLGRISVYGPHASRLHEEVITITARWTPPADRTKPLVPFAREGEQRTLELLQQNLGPGQQREVSAAVREKLTAAIRRDVDDLHAHLQPRGEEALADAVKKLRTRGEAEASELIRILQDQRKRVIAELAKNKDWQQLQLGLNDDELKQRDDDIKHWESWLTNVNGDLQREPARIREFYSVKSHRIEPVGLVYLVPSS
ncbi:MAG: DISARM system SNF2-like helicase DrmD [Verrucomicrobia bacterium]|nr:DISARM system SNF2-like helicase DrmD [Verrucomicrobiota bacterium]